MPKDTKTLGNNKARACESLGFVHKKRLCQRFDTTSYQYGGNGGHPFTEGNAWQYFWYVPHNIQALMELTGGTAGL